MLFRSEYDFTITLFGKACEYLPYIYASFVRAGKNGVFKSRTPFSIIKVCVCEKNILIEDADKKTVQQQIDELEKLLGRKK